MINKIFSILLSFLLFYMSYKILIEQEFVQRGMEINLSESFLRFPMGFIFLFFGILIIWSIFNKK